jgi:MoaA/NifB/PqqE/SkfB family radical SAM enzyme
MERWRNELKHPEFRKNWTRTAPSFANINLLGACNVDCYFCLGKDIEGQWKGAALNSHWGHWPNFEAFLEKCQAAGVKRLYVTGQNTDSLLYTKLSELITWLQSARGFEVGLRTNGYLAHKMLPVLNQCERNVGYSIHSLDPETNWQIMRRRDIPDWSKLIPATRNVRVSTVLNRYNQNELPSLLRYIAQFDNVKYIQVRRICTDTREDFLLPDVLAYEETFEQVKRDFPLVGHFYNAEVFRMYGKDVCFWRTVKTDIESFNYYTDGTINDEYFVIEGYMRESANYPKACGVPQKVQGLEGYWRDEKKRVRLTVQQ